MVDFFYHLDYEVEKIEVESVEVEEGAGFDNAAMPVLEEAADATVDFWSLPKKDKKTKRCRACGYPANRWPATEEATAERPSNLDGNPVIHAKVFAAAVKYQALGLQKLSSQKFVEAVRVNWNHHMFGEAARIAYTTTPDSVRELRDCVCDAIHHHPQLLDKPEIGAIVRDISALNYELLLRAHGKSAV
jgi:hypothetical protein